MVYKSLFGYAPNGTNVQNRIKIRKFCQTFLILNHKNGIIKQ